MDSVTTHFWVNPFDLDINNHMNNGRYLSIMDLGRYDLMLKSKSFWMLISKSIYPVVVSESIRFKKSLEPFQGFHIKTQIEAWTEKDFYIKQEFFRNDEIYAVGYIKGRFRQRGRKNSLKTHELFELLGLEMPAEKTSELSLAQDQLEKNL
jgi:acyl-CoA thioesterase FadM